MFTQRKWTGRYGKVLDQKTITNHNNQLVDTRYCGFCMGFYVSFFFMRVIFLKTKNKLKLSLSQRSCSARSRAHCILLSPPMSFYFYLFWICAREWKPLAQTSMSSLCILSFYITQYQKYFRKYFVHVTHELDSLFLPTLFEDIIVLLMPSKLITN